MAHPFLIAPATALFWAFVIAWFTRWDPRVNKRHHLRFAISRLTMTKDAWRRISSEARRRVREACCT